MFQSIKKESQWKLGIWLAHHGEQYWPLELLPNKGWESPVQINHNPQKFGSRALFSMQGIQNQPTDSDSQNIPQKFHLWLGTAHSHILNWAQHPSLQLVIHIRMPTWKIYGWIRVFLFDVQSFFIWRNCAPFLFNVKISSTALIPQLYSLQKQVAALQLSKHTPFSLND